MALQLRRKCKTLRNPNFIRLFSSSSSSSSATSSSNGEEDKKESQSPPSPKSSFSSYFSDVRASLKQSPPQPPRRPSSPSPSTESSSFASLRPSKNVASLEEIRKNLSEFRRRSAGSGDNKSSSSFSQTISFQDLYKRNVVDKSDEGSSGPAATGTSKSGRMSFDAIRESLRQLNANQSANDRFKGPGDGSSRKVLDPYSLKSFKDSLRMKPDDQATKSNIVLGGTETLPTSVFGKELEPKSEAESQAMKTAFLKSYSYEELGNKLLELRPADTKGFSLGELNERLKKLREIEEKELDSRIGGVSFKDLRESLVKLQSSTDDKTKKTMQRFDILGHLRTPSFMLAPPKEHLVEKYFHPDKMSSKEKLKLELQRVRDEFKMSESDCGSSRVQVAQLTTKIKHLSSVLAKKDKHSRKGLLAMVQRRKKLLKYLRRTDWDSYCMVISKLGLRDNPDYKH